MIIGYTTGVFDMFHIGHLNILKNAKEYCDYLVVGVSTDELVKRYKGEKPIIPFDERKEIINSIKYVDKVVAQVTLDKIDAWNELHYNVLFHGDDWKGTQLYDDVERYLQEKGVKIMYFPYTKNISSTKLKEIVFGKGGGVV